MAPHDEAFKKLLQAFFAEFMALFFPELYRLIDFSCTRFLMQELLVDVVGGEKRTVDLLVEVRLRGRNAFILIHLEPQSYAQADFGERMFLYFARLLERHRKSYKVILPVAIFTGSRARDEPGGYWMHFGKESIVEFRYRKLELARLDWRRFAKSDNPVAAALLSRMGYNERDRRELRLAYLRMLARLHPKLDDAKLALVMSIADLYYRPEPEEDRSILRELQARDPEEAERVMELMPAWKRWGYEEGLEEGLEKGKEKGIEAGRAESVRKLLAKGFTPGQIADLLDLPQEEVAKLRDSH